MGFGDQILFFSWEVYKMYVMYEVKLRILFFLVLARKATVGLIALEYVQSDQRAIANRAIAPTALVRME